MWRCVLVVCVVLLVMAGSAEAQTFVPVAPGVEFMQRTDPGPRRVSALRINLCASGVRMRATTSGERGARTSSWASGAGVVAAVNGGFFLSGARPDSGVAAGGGQEWPDSQDSAVRGYVAFGPRQLTHSPAPDVTPLPEWVEEAVNGDATLVQGGVAVNCGGCGGGRAPRTAVGYTSDRQTLMLVVVDGRSTSSVGMTIDEMAVLMASFGVERAMNLDGGGSSSMWVSGRGVVNRPSDGSERSVANHLGVFATGSGLRYGCPEGHGSAYARSGFPGGATRFVVEQGTTVSGNLQFLNTGTFAWDGGTHLAPIPRDQPSPLAVDSWVSRGRITTPAATTPPGELGVFEFTLRAPDSPGVTRQYLNLVQEGVTWFAESYGPADNVYYVEVESVARPQRRAEVVAISAGGRFVAAPGEQLQAWVDVRNTGSATWPAQEIRLGTTGPRDRSSGLAGPGWLGANRAAANAVAVAPGEAARFALVLQAPGSVGVYEETFGFVHEGVAWFADDGGPADDALRFVVDVQEPQAEDTGVADTGIADTGIADTGSPDTGGDLEDSGVADAPMEDSGGVDTGDEDSSAVGDTAAPDVGRADTESTPGRDGGADDDVERVEDAAVRSGSERSSEGCAAVAGGERDVPWWVLVVWGCGWAWRRDGWIFSGGRRT